MPAAVTKSPEISLVEVALPIPLRKNFTYRLPEGFASRVSRGSRLLVPFGRRVLTGYVIGFPRELQTSPEFREEDLKDAIELVDIEPLLTDEILVLAEWTAEYYAASLGEMLKASLPAGINTGVRQILSPAKLSDEAPYASRTTLRARIFERIASAGEATSEELAAEFGSAGAKRTIREMIKCGEVVSRQESATARVKPKFRKAVRLLKAAENGKTFTEQQQLILTTLSSVGGEMLFAELLDRTGIGASAINTLKRRGNLEIFAREVLRDPLEDARFPTPEDLTLNAEQTFAFTEIEKSLGRNEYNGFLLHGVTGSGKTEVYIRAMRSALARNRSALMLVPEISLTPIFSRRLRAIFGGEVAILHSNLSPGERYDEWRRIRTGAARLVIGTRSAVFAPVEDIGLLIVDEEHDGSYRQHESPFYNARDVAVMRANLANCTVVLGSATPSLESFYNAKTGKYKYLQLQNRIGGRPMAKAELVDMREVFKRAGKDLVLSPRLVGSIRETHEKGEQSIILLNRRGFSSFVLCRSCGETLRCRNCDITLTFHKSEGKIVCHYCGYSTQTPGSCPFCDSEYLYFIGEGTEQLEGLLSVKFPDLRIARVDRDSMKRKGELDRTLIAFDRGEIDMLVGTQMLAKGHDFHNVTLVGVISVDIGLGLPDFRSAERTFQLLTQVAGRAGRGDLPGLVLIQTYYPEHYALRYAVEQDFEKFYTHEMRFRERMSYPPFVSIASFLIAHSDMETTRKHAGILRTSLDRANVNGSCHILGPAPASISRLKGEYRLQFILRSASRKELRNVIDLGLRQAEAFGFDRRKATLQIDPIELM